MAKNTKKLKVSIIILTTNALEMTREQLLDVSKLYTKGFECECIVADNGSEDKTEEDLKNYKLPNMAYKFIQNDANLGFAGGNNTAIKQALNSGADYIILINNDLILSIDLVQKLVNFMEKNPKVGLTSPKMYFAKGYEFHKNKYSRNELGRVIWYAGGVVNWENIYSSHHGVDEVDTGQFDEVTETDFANGACVIIRKEVFEKIGFLDETFFLYWEDADFSIRAKRFGFEVKYFPGTNLWHKVSASTGGSGSPSNDYFLVRNRLYFALKHANFRAKFAVLRDTFRLVWNGRAWQKKGAIDALLGVKGKGAWPPAQKPAGYGNQRDEKNKN